MKTQQKTEIPQNTTKPAPFLGKNVTSENKIMKNKANLNSSNSTANPCSKVGYNDLQPKTKNGTNPNKANFRNANSPVFQKIKKMENEPNCNESDVAASNCYRNTYNYFYHKIRQKNEPKRTQLKPIKPIKANLSEHKERGAQATRQKNPHNSGNNQTKNKKTQSKPNLRHLFRSDTVLCLI